MTARSPALLRTAWLLTGDRGRAEDLLQESLARAWRAWPGIRHREQPEPYVRRIMVNHLVNARRRRWRWEVPTERVPERTVSDLADDVELRIVIGAALNGLPVRQRAVIVLRFFEDLTAEQTADVLGCSVGTVKSQTSRALAELRACRALNEVAPTAWGRILPPAAGARAAVERVRATARAQRRADALRRAGVAGLATLVVGAAGVLLRSLTAGVSGGSTTVSPAAPATGGVPGAQGVLNAPAIASLALLAAAALVVAGGLPTRAVEGRRLAAAAVASVLAIAGQWLCADAVVVSSEASWQYVASIVAADGSHLWGNLIHVIVVSALAGVGLIALAGGAVHVLTPRPDRLPAAARLRATIADMAAMAAGIPGFAVLTALLGLLLGAGAVDPPPAPAPLHVWLMNVALAVPLLAVAVLLPRPAGRRSAARRTTARRAGALAAAAATANGLAGLTFRVAGMGGHGSLPPLLVGLLLGLVLVVTGPGNAPGAATRPARAVRWTAVLLACGLGQTLPITLLGARPVVGAITLACQASLLVAASAITYATFRSEPPAAPGVRAAS